MLNSLLCIIKRDLLLAFRRRSDVLTTLFFFIIVVTLFPLGVGPEAALLRTMAPGILWVAALLASMLALGRLFALDYADGTLEQMLLSPEPLTLIVIGKVIAHWLVAGLPLVVLAPLLAVQFDLPGDSVLILFYSLLIGTPVLSLIGAIGAALRWDCWRATGVAGGGAPVRFRATGCILRRLAGLHGGLRRAVTRANRAPVSGTSGLAPEARPDPCRGAQVAPARPGWHRRAPALVDSLGDQHGGGAQQGEVRLRGPLPAAADRQRAVHAAIGQRHRRALVDARRRIIGG